MAGNGVKAAALIRGGGAKAKLTAARFYAIAKDPVTQEKTRKLVDDGKKVYEALTSPEAKRLYRQAADLVKQARKK